MESDNNTDTLSGGCRDNCTTEEEDGKPEKPSGTDYKETILDKVEEKKQELEKKRQELAEIFSREQVPSKVAPATEEKKRRKRQIEMEITRIEPSGKLKIDFSEDLQNFDFFKNLDLSEVKFAEI